jgi:glycine hydroxymethyltransferase
LIVEVLDGVAKNGDAGDAQIEHSVRERAINLCKRFPIY